MNYLTRFRLLFLALAISALRTSGQDVIINEIMYHPASEDVRQEYVELFNAGPTNVSLAGWRINGGINFVFATNASVGAGKFLVLAANLSSFSAKYPAVTNVVGDWLTMTVTNLVGRSLTNWTPVLSNRRNTITLRNAAGTEIDSVTYADEGDWSVRQKGPMDNGQRGWIWSASHDGLGSSLELINPALRNDNGQNWRASAVPDGTPGRTNSAHASNVAPLILETKHLPIIPRSTDFVSVSALIVDDLSTNVTVALRLRTNTASPTGFASTPMFDDGMHGDGAALDGRYGTLLSPMPNNTLIEFYVQAADLQGNTRTWPGPALDAEELEGSLGQTNNALFQVDNSAYTGTAPLYKLIITSAETTQLQTIFNSNPESDAQVSATFISLEPTGTECRYRCGIRNRGHGSRSSPTHNYRINFASDNLWKNISGLNLNASTTHAQHFGAVLAQKAGIAGADSRAVQLRVNNGPGPGGTPGNGHYAANEAVNGDWADNHFPDDSGGNVYRAVRDLLFRFQPQINDADMDYRGEDPTPYRETYSKETNVSEDDWQDLIGMLSVVGINNPAPYTPENVRQVINVEQWLTHIAFMSIVGNAESGINSGHNDDYSMYRGVKDPRFILLYYDLDQILSQGGSYGFSDTIYGSTNQPPRGSSDDDGLGQAMTRFLLATPEFNTLYLQTLQRLLDTVFMPTNFNALIDQTLGSYASSASISAMKNYNNNRRNFLLSGFLANVPPASNAPIATLSGEPRSPTPFQTATLTVGGEGVTHYRYQMNNGAYQAETPVATPIVIGGVTAGSTNVVRVIGRGTNNLWQSANSATVSCAWVVNTSWPAVRLNEVLARNDSAVNHSGTFPDIIELYNEGAATVNLSGMRLTDDPADPDKFAFPGGTMLGAGDYLIVYADSAGTPGLHTGFGLGANGETIHLFNSAANGGALLDSITFGLQLPDRSLGRFGRSGNWLLTQPTFGSTNVAVATGNPASLRINEWLAASQPPTTEDFIELYNLDPLPVALGGLHLTDEPIGAPARHRIADLSFIAGSGHASFIADGNTGGGAEHVGFGLAAESGEIGLLSAGLATIDCIPYGPQRPDVAEGRCPDGATNFIFMTTPTRGAANACPPPPPPPPPPPVMVNLLPLTNAWRFHENTNLDGVNWQAPAFVDATWPPGQGVFGSGNLGFEVVRTSLQASQLRVTRYFRTTFVVSADFSPTSLQFSNIVDDGAVFYLNGVEAFRYNMPSGAVTFGTTAAGSINGAPGWTGPVNVPLGSLQPGTNSLAVEVHQFVNSQDVFFGTRFDAVFATNAVTPTAGTLVLNEVLADNASYPEPDGATSDWIEIYNAFTNTLDLGDMSLSDSPANARRWVFPQPTLLQAGGLLVIRCDADQPASATNTGFGLKANGDSLYLFKRLADGGTVLDSLIFGLQTPDLSIGRVPNGSSNWVLNLPSAGAANLAAVTGEPTLLRINEWMADPAGGDDWFEVFNSDSRPVALGHLRLTDTFGDPNSYRIPALSFIGVGSNAYVRFEADDPSTPAGAEHVNFKLSKDGDSIYLLATNNGTQIDAVGFGTQQLGVSQGRLPDGGTNVVSFPETPTPKNANYLPLGTVVVNEVLTHTDPPLEDAIELRNNTAQPINVGGWFLSDANDSPLKYRIADNTIIPAFGFKVFYEFQFNNDLNGTPFSLSSSMGDEVYLTEMSTNGSFTGRRAVAEFGPSVNGVSFGRHHTSLGVDFTAMSLRTFGADSPASLPQFRAGTGRTNAYPKVGPVVVNEIMYHPPDIIVPGVSTNDNLVEEFIELHNPGTVAAPLFDQFFPSNTWRLRDAVDFDFAPATWIAPGGHLLVVSFDPGTNAAARMQFQSRYGSNSVLVGPFSGKLDNSGERVELQKPDSPQPGGRVPYVLVEKIEYADRGAWPTNADGAGPSLQRRSVTGYANDPTNWMAAAASPGPSGDMDGDGMSDAWEMLYNFNKNNPADAGQDADGDGRTNLEEFLSGTDPRNANSALRLAAQRNGAVVELRFTAVAGRAYTVQYRTAFDGSPWLRLADVPVAGVTAVMQLNDTSAGPDEQRFYRVVTPTAP